MNNPSLAGGRELEVGRFRRRQQLFDGEQALVGGDLGQLVEFGAIHGAMNNLQLLRSVIRGF